MVDPVEIVAPDYCAVWRTIIVDFLALPESELTRIIDKWRGRMMDRTPDGMSMFYHESPEYYVAPFLVPESLRALTPNYFMRLCWNLYPVIGRYDRECKLDPSCFAAMRREIDRAVEDWVAKHYLSEQAHD